MKTQVAQTTKLICKGDHGLDLEWSNPHSF